MKTIYTLTLFFGFAYSVMGQQELNALNAIACPYSDISILPFVSSSKDAFTEDFDVSRGVYSITSPTAGVLLEFNFNFIVSGIWLHDSGYSFRSFKGKLPFDLQWGMNSETLLESKYSFDSDGDNPYLFRRTFEKGSITAYFYNNRLKSLYIIARPDAIKLADEKNITNWGFRLYPNGKKISGDCMDGLGTMIWDDKATSYEGEWKWGMPHGKGNYKDASGNTFEGNFKLGFAWGTVQINYPEIAVYKGDLVFSRKIGHGKIVYKNGMIYDGDWQFDTMQGQGSYMLNSNYQYTGSFENNKFNGFGKLTTPEGYYEGMFKNGKPHGKGEQFARRTEGIYRGTWVNGSKEGRFYYNDPLNGTRYVFFKGDREMVQEQK
jgi:hypothetical protein